MALSIMPYPRLARTIGVASSLTVLRAAVNVDYNPRCQGKRSLADLFFIRQWRDLMSPRAHIERHFAWIKRHFGLKYFHVQGYLAVTQFAFRVYIAALIVAFIATRCRRPDLALHVSRCLPLPTPDRSIMKGPHTLQSIPHPLQISKKPVAVVLDENW